jgi:parvulin-like peptidyl-prolyl isomerase
MNRISKIATVALAGAFLAGMGVPAEAEVIEEIVAWVNGEIITRSELEQEEQSMMSEVYRRYTGEELDEQVRILREELLMQMIDRKVLVDKAATMYDLEKMGDAFYESFKEQQGISDDEELAAALAREGMTMESLRQRLIEMFAPDEVLRYEVGSRVAVSDPELQAYYDEHQEEFRIPAEATIREIVLLAEDEATREQRRAEAEQVRVRVTTGGESFADVARELSEAGTNAEGGLLGPLKRGELSDELEQVAFSLPPGDVSEIIEMPYGFHLCKVESRSESRVPPLEEIGEDLRRWLEDRKYFEQRMAFVTRVRSEAEWCVKPAYADRLPPDIPNQPCHSQ